MQLMITPQKNPLPKRIAMPVCQYTFGDSQTMQVTKQTPESSPKFARLGQK